MLSLEEFERLVAMLDANGAGDSSARLKYCWQSQRNDRATTGLAESAMTEASL